MYKILLLPSAQKDLNSLQGKTFSQINNKVLTLNENPRPKACMKLTAENGYCLRSGHFRIIYRIDDKEKEVFIYRIKHRKDAY